MKYHPPIYYTIRTIVRTVFWATLALCSLWLVSVANSNYPDPCDVTTNPDFTWSWNSDPVPLDSCSHPYLTVLHDNHTYSWVEDTP